MFLLDVLDIWSGTVLPQQPPLPQPGLRDESRGARNGHPREAASSRATAPPRLCGPSNPQPGTNVCHDHEQSFTSKHRSLSSDFILVSAHLTGLEQEFTRVGPSKPAINELC